MNVSTFCLPALFNTSMKKILFLSTILILCINFAFAQPFTEVSKAIDINCMYENEMFMGGGTTFLGNGQWWLLWHICGRRDGTRPLIKKRRRWDCFYNISTNVPYQIVVRHRNHLAVVSANLVSIPNTLPYKFYESSNGRNVANLEIGTELFA